MLIRTAFLVLLAVACARPAMAQIRLEGTVQLADGSPAVGVTVVVSGVDLRERFQTTTGSRGEYVFANITPGGWIRVDASRDGRVFATGGGLATRNVERMDLGEPRPQPVYVAPPPAPREAPVPATTAARSGPPAESSRPSPTSPTAPPIAASQPAPAPVMAAPPPPPRVRLSGPGGLRGVVRSEDGIGLPGASVGIEGAGGFVVTDTEGKYALIDLPVDAPLTVVASVDGFETVRQEVSVTRGAPGIRDFVLPLSSLSERVEVKYEVPLLNASSGASRLTLRPAQVASLPSLGERDIFRALQLLPGISGTQEASSGLYVRGGTPDQNLVTLDGFTLYHVDHLFGYFSAFNMDALDQVEFSKTAFSAADGGRLSGSLHLTGKSLEAPQRTGFLNVSMLSTGGLVSMPLGSRGSLLIAGRRSFQSPLYNDILGLVNQGGGAPGGGAPRPGGPSPFGGNDPFASTPASWFYDVNSKIQLKFGSRDVLSISLYDGRDDVDNSRTLDLGATNFPRFGNQTTAVGLPSDPILNLNEIQRWTNRGVGVTWRRQWKPANSTTLSVGGSRYEGVRDFSSSLTSKSTGEDFSFSSGRGGPRGQSESNGVKDLTVRLDHTMSASGGHQLTAGVEATALDVDYASQTAAVQASGPGGGVISSLVGLLDQSGVGQLLAVYAEDTWNPFARFVVTPGIRFVRYSRTSESFAEPRVVANYQLTSRLQLKAGYGQFHQVIGRIQYEDLSQGDREFWGLADGQAVPVSTARQAMAGASYETAGFLIDAEVYDKQLDRLTMFAPRLTIGAAPGAGSAYLYYGRARAQGLELLFQKKFGRNTGWASYTQSAAEQSFPDLDENYFLASHDQNYELKFADTMKIGTRWTMGATWMYGSGRPFTPATGIESVELPFRDLTVDRITYGAKNSSRLPAYHRLDLSMQGDFRFMSMSHTVGVTAFNVYNRQNIWYRSYQTFGGTGAANDVTLMGRAINIFVRFGL